MISKKQKQRFKKFKSWIQEYQHAAGNWLMEMERTDGEARLRTAQYAQMWLDDAEAYAKQFAQAVSAIEDAMIIEGITVSQDMKHMKFGSKESRKLYNRLVTARDEADAMKRELETLVDGLLA